jgi:hypothetical protein
MRRAAADIGLKFGSAFSETQPKEPLFLAGINCLLRNPRQTG